MKKGHPFLIIIIAVAILGALSIVPWGSLTGGQLKDFNLLGDILRGHDDAQAASNSVDEQIDPALAEATQSVKVVDSVPDTAVFVPKAPLAPRVNGQVRIEDYTPDSRGLARLSRTLREGKRTARIAVIGDSYIEGDIFTMHLREMLQDIYGGNGVGYMPMTSELTGFRVSVRQSCNGWTAHDVRKTKGNKFFWLSGEWYTPDAGAVTTYKGTSRLKHHEAWDNTRVLFVAPGGGKITMATDSGSVEYPVEASPSVQQIQVNGRTAMARVTPSVPGGTFLGTWLDGNGGIAVDNMSLRGNSGITHRNLNQDIIKEMNALMPYDCVIVEYGLNALTSKQKDYTKYSGLMRGVVEKIKECYPGADIILMGIGDRGQKYNGTVASLPTAPAMTKAQRDAARETGVLFWDTREVMGGEDAVVDWRDRGLINADYIHMNGKGGAELARLFVPAIKQAIKK